LLFTYHSQNTVDESDTRSISSIVASALPQRFFPNEFLLTLLYFFPLLFSPLWSPCLPSHVWFYIDESFLIFSAHFNSLLINSAVASVITSFCNFHLQWCCLASSFILSTWPFLLLFSSILFKQIFSSYIFLPIFVLLLLHYSLNCNASPKNSSWFLLPFYDPSFCWMRSIVDKFFVILSIFDVAVTLSPVNSFHSCSYFLLRSSFDKFLFLLVLFFLQLSFCFSYIILANPIPSKRSSW